ncbi:hypothetical protein BDZ97DRAFT_757671 [Flammula alnicola]|nr:hypothetical protein BDZ97DRAFT_757671 [Flammula alnicola]
MGRPLNPEIRNDSMAAVCVIFQKIEGKPYRARFLMLGDESWKQYSYMVMTQSAPFPGWKGMDPELIPKFEEGEREAVARELLKMEGGLIYVFIPLDAFNTRFAGITQFEFRTMLH